MIRNNNILSKCLLLLILAMGWCSSAWAQDFPVEGKVYTIKAKFANNQFDSYLTNNGTQLTFVHNESDVTAGSYWIAERSGESNFQWRFRNVADESKLLNANTGLGATATNFNVRGCGSVSGVYHLEGMATNRNVGTWGFGSGRSGFGASGNNGCWATGSHFSGGSPAWTTDYEITLVSDYRLIINGDNNYTVTYGGTGYHNGDAMPSNIDEVNLNNLKGFSINCTGKFIYGPVIRKDRRTITYTIKDRVASDANLTTGFYQFQLEDNSKVNNVNNRINNSGSNINTQSNIIYVMPYKDVPTGGDQNLAKYSGVPTYANEAATFFYIERNGSNLQVQSVNGHYAVNDGNKTKPVANRTPSPVTDGFDFPSGQLRFKGWVIQGTWSASSSTGNEGPRVAYSGGTNYEQYNAAKVDLSQYAVYKVLIDNTTNAGDIANDPSVSIQANTTAAAKNRGLSKVYQNGYFFFERGYEPTLADFTVSGSSISNMDMEIEGTGEIRTLHFKESGSFSGFSPAPVNGQWADGTKWFTMRNFGKSRYASTSNASIDNDMYLTWSTNDVKPTDAEGMWCFVKDDGDNFRIYNKAYGPDFVFGIAGTNNESHTRIFHLSEAVSDNTHFHFVTSNKTYNGKTQQCIVFGNVSGGLNNIGGRYLGIWTTGESNLKNDNGSAFYIERVDESIANATRVYNTYRVSVMSDDAALAFVRVPATIGYATPGQQGSKQVVNNDYYMLFEQSVNVPALTLSAFTVTSNSYPEGVTTIEVGTVDGATPTLPQIRLKGHLVLPHVIHRPNGNLWRAKRNNYNGTETNTIGKQTEDYTVVKLKDETTTKLQHTGVFEITHFLAPGETRELWMPSTSSSANDKEAKILNYMRWFNYQTESIPDPAIVNLAADQKGDVYAGAWYYQNGIVVGSSVNGVYPKRFVHINMPSDLTKDQTDYEYTLANEATRYTDFSNNFTNGTTPSGGASYLGNFSDPNEKATGSKNLVEPTIGTRQIYHLRSAHEMAKKLSACTGDTWLEEETITFPTRSTSTGSYKDVIPLEYNFIDYWAYNASGELRSVKQNGTTIKTTVADNGTGITIVSSNCNDYLAGSQVFVEANSWASRDAGHYVSFDYPNNGVITLAEGETSRSATIYVRLNVDGTEYNIKKFTLVFQNGVEAIPYYEVLQDVDHVRSDKSLAAQFGTQENPSGVYSQLNFHYPQNYLMGAPGAALTTGAGYYAFPYNFDEVSYSYFANGMQWSDWGEYGMRNNAQTATRHNSLGDNPYFLSINYLRELYKRKDALQEKEQAQAVLDNPSSDEQQRAEAEYHLNEANKILAEVTDATLQEAYNNNYYIYVDASEQPGQVGRLRINEKLCTGTRIYGTAWLSCATAYTAGSPDPASVIFRFKGVREDGSMTTIYSYCPGQISNIARNSERQEVYAHDEQRWNGQSYKQALWQQVAFSFVNTYDASEFEGFVLEVFNNCRGSSGGDIFLDDVRLYVKTPQVNVDNAAPICGDELSIVRISTDFDAIIDALQGNTHVDDETLTYYGTYAILDKEVYDKRMAQTAEPTQDDVEEAFNMALIGETDKEKCTIGGKFLPELYAFHDIKFYPKFEKHKHVTYAMLVGDNILEEAGYMYQYNNQGEIIGRNLVFNCKINDERLAGKQYYIVFAANIVYTDMSTKEKADYHEFFSMGDICCVRSEFKTMRAKMVKVEGSEELDPYNIDYCPGTSPTIALNSYGYDINGELIQEHGVYYDWYMGTKEEYEKEYVWLDNTEIDIEDLDKYSHREILTAEDFCMDHCLLNFRYFYPKASAKELFDGTVKVHHFVKDDATDTEYELTEKMIAKLKEWTSSGKLRLHLTAISVDLSESDEHGMTHVLAIQQGAKLRYEHTDTEKENPILYCMDPVQISFRTKLEAPSASVGFADIDYDGTPYNRNKDKNVLYSLPLRINLGQIDRIAQSAEGRLTLPLRIINQSGYYKVDGDNDELVNTDKIHLEIDDDAKYVYVVETNDPQWTILSESNGIEFLKPVGVLEEIDANKVRDDGNINTIGISFYNVTNSEGRRFEPRESYYYILRTAFNEVLNPGVKQSEKYVVPEVQCKGNILIPLKIVPEYMKWTGKESRDWNNDRNWVRADYDELHAGNQTSGGQSPLLGYSRNESGSPVSGQPATSGDYNGLPYDANDRKQTEDDMDMYIPMDKAQYEGSIYANTFAYAPMTDTKVIIPGDAEQFPILTQHSRDTQDGKAGLLKLADAETNTPYIIYDMVAVPAGDNLTADKYYDNQVDAVTFLPASAMGNAHWLGYKRAWVEYELDVNRWYTLASPLQNTFAGEWYAPTDGGRQLTPHFYGIEYSPELNHRFQPAIYQRSWDSEGNNPVYLKTGSKVENSYIQADWSHVYNDVKKEYSEGAFSVKVADDYMDNQPAGGKSLVRMPKADTKYTYYDSGNQTGDKADDAIAVTASRSRLWSDKLKDGDTFSQTIVNQTAGNNFFLVGNPFMSPMDMEAFFAANPGLEKKYWIISSDQQHVSVKAETGWISTTGEGAHVAPLQGFFVKAADADQTSLTVHYTAAMQGAADQKPLLRAPGRTRAAEAVTDVIRLTAERNGASSTALIVMDEAASDDFSEGEDCEAFIDGNLIDQPTVYTSAGAMAQTINVRRTLDMVPVGIISDDEDEAVLRFDLSQSRFETVILYDRELDTCTEVFDGTEVRMDGNSHGRYFISGTMQDEDGIIKPIAETRRGVWTVSGMYCGEDVKGLQPGLYIVNGVKVTLR